MAEIQRARLFGRMNPMGYKALQSATASCRMRQNPYVEIVHWLDQILQLPDSDLHRIVRHFELDPSRLAADITATVDGLPRGGTAMLDISRHLEDAAEKGWVYATLLFNEPCVRTGYVVVGMLKTPSLQNAFLSVSRELSKIKLET